MDYICDICATKIEKTSGYAYTTKQVVMSLGYWKKIFERNKNQYADNDAMIVIQANLAINEATPWIVCGACAPVVTADQQRARQFAAAGQDPPGCGPAEQMPAMMAAAYAWSLVFNEWPTSVQIGRNPITHDPEKGTRCDFCHRVVYGEEKFMLFGKAAYEQLVAEGARFIRTPSPSGTDKDGDPYWIACATCMEWSKAGNRNAQVPEKKPWWRVW